MVQVLHSGDTGELELSGTAQELHAFSRFLRRTAGSLGLSENRHPFPYERSLSEITSRETPEHSTALMVAEEGTLRIRGSREALDLLADTVEHFASEADTSDHCHVDSSTYDYIAPGSEALVIAFR